MQFWKNMMLKAKEQNAGTGMPVNSSVAS